MGQAIKSFSQICQQSCKSFPLIKRSFPFFDCGCEAVLCTKPLWKTIKQTFKLIMYLVEQQAFIQFRNFRQNTYRLQFALEFLGFLKSRCDVNNHVIETFIYIICKYICIFLHYFCGNICFLGCFFVFTICIFILLLIQQDVYDV